MILYVQPWSSDKDLGKAYNDAFRCSDVDYICFTDADTMFTTRTYGKQIEEAIERYDIHLATCYVNRNGYMYSSEHQISPHVNRMSNDMKEHFMYGGQHAMDYWSECEDITDGPPLSGAMILMSRKCWETIGGFPEGGGMLGIDNTVHLTSRACGIKLWIMKGVYMYHWYRNGNLNDKDHLL